MFQTFKITEIVLKLRTKSGSSPPSHQCIMF